MSNHSSYFQTSDAKVTERFSFWKEAVCDTYVQLDCEYNGQTPFEGMLVVDGYDTITYSKVRGLRHQVYRRRHNISRSNENDFLLSLQLKETAHITQRGNNSTLYPFDFVIYDSTEPYDLELTDHFRMIVLQFPKERLLSRLSNAEMLVAKKISATSDIGNFVSGNIVQLCNMLSAQKQPSQILFQEVLLDLIASSLATIEDSQFELSTPEQHILLRAKTFILSHLSNPDLDLQTVATAVGMSVRRLSEIFASNGLTIAGFIREARLNRVASELQDVRFIRQTISEIALRNGFNNIQNFSTSFRKHFNCTPSEHRNQPSKRLS